MLKRAAETGIIDSESALGLRFRRSVPKDNRKKATPEYKKKWAGSELDTYVKKHNKSESFTEEKNRPWALSFSV